MIPDTGHMHSRVAERTRRLASRTGPMDAGENTFCGMIGELCAFFPALQSLDVPQCACEKGGSMETKLHRWHLENGARMVDFGGWDMPVQYETGPRAEHLRVREAAGLFDIDHMGRLEISGPQAEEFLQRVQTWDVSRLKPGRAHYSMILEESGGIVDDIFIYRRTDSWLVVVNASNAPKDLAWFREHAAGLKVSIRDLRDETCMVALQGPAALAGPPGPGPERRPGEHRLSPRCRADFRGETGDPLHHRLYRGARLRDPDAG